nr:MAG TPA_asm: hypothetical protein [Caudoviricetes sp.]
MHLIIFVICFLFPYMLLLYDLNIPPLNKKVNKKLCF